MAASDAPTPDAAMSAAAPFAVLDDGVRIARTGPQHAGALEALQHLVFPTLVDVERFKAPHYLRHIELFPEGQFVALDGERVVGMTSTLRLDFDFAHVDHTFADVIAGGWLTSHQPAGAWLYGADIGVHPDWRGHGIARALYAARQDVVRRLGLAGQVTVGMLSGFGAVMGRLDIASYYAAVCAGTLADPTVSAQLHVGFEARGLLRGYLHDPVCDGCGALLVLPADRDIPIRRQK